MELEKILKNKYVLTGICLGFAYWKHGEMGVMSIDKAYLVSFSVLVLIFFVDLQNKSFKHDSPQIVTPNDHGSTDMIITPVDEHAVIPKGSIFAAGFHVSGKDGTYILPMRHVYIGKNTIMSSLIVESVDIHVLPEGVYDLITKYPGQFKPPYFYGEKTLESLDEVLRGDSEEEQSKYLFQKVKTLQSQVNWQRARIADQARELENLMSHLERVTRGDRWYEGLIGKAEDE